MAAVHSIGASIDRDYVMGGATCVCGPLLKETTRLNASVAKIALYIGVKILTNRSGLH